MECAACLDALVAKRVASGDRIEHGKSLLVRIVSMLSKLADRFSPQEEVREEPVRYGIEDEDEDDGRASQSEGLREREETVGSARFSANRGTGS